MVRAVLGGGVTTAAVAAVALGALGAPAYADGGVTRVQGTAFPDPVTAQLSLVGCGDLYHRTDEAVQPMIGRGPGAAPLGQRSLSFDLAGGNASGALYTVSSMLSTTTASLAVNAAGHATGVAYAGYQEPDDAGTSLVWLGRSDLVTPGGAWQTVEVATRSYVWSKYDMATGQRLGSGPHDALTVPSFTALHGGDGPGVYTIGFGCDGTPFSIDAMRVGGAAGVSTYDIEGLSTSITDPTASAVRVQPGGSTRISASLRTGTGDRIPHATMILESRVGDGAWKPVQVVEVGPTGASATVSPEVTTHYRWRFVDRPLAEGSASAPVLVTVVESEPTDGPSPTQTPTPGPTDGPGQSSSPSPSPSQSSSPSPSDPTQEPSSSSPSPTPSASDSTDASPSDTPSPSEVASELASGIASPMSPGDASGR